MSATGLPTVFLDRDNEAVTEHEAHSFVAEASTLGWAPGEWPVVITTNMGNKLPFLFESRQERDDDLLSVTYRQVCGCIRLRVFND